MVKGKFLSVKKIGAIVATLAIVAVITAGCGAPPRNASESGGSSDKEPAIKVEWSLQSDCGMCHSAQKNSQTQEGLAACVHATKAQATCASCHNDEATLSTVHEGKTASDAMPTKLDKTTIAPQTCRSAGCHDLGDAEYLALTANITELTDATGKMVNPHSIVGQKGHDEITCANCHVEHSKKTNTDMEYCVTCHHSGKFGTCSECH